MYNFVRQLFIILLPVIFVFLFFTETNASEPKVSNGPLIGFIKQFSRIDDVRIDKSLMHKFYQAKNYQPVWITGNKTKLKQLVQALKKSDTHGLKPEYYGIQSIESRLKTSSNLDKAKLEILLTQAVFDYTRDLHDGRLNPKTLGIKWHIEQVKLDPVDAMHRVISASDIGREIEKFAPQHFAYQKLKANLQQYIEMAAFEGERVHIPKGPSMKPGKSDKRIPLLRKRLAQKDIGLQVQGDPNSTVYSDDLVFAVEQFQANNGLTIDGIVGNQTIAVLNRSVKGKLKKIAATMEKWRWMPTDLGERHIIVSSGASHLDVYEGGKSVLDMRTVVGRRSRQTPSFSSEIYNIVFNPPWNVPSRIARVDLLPKIQKDPGYLSRNGYSLHSESGRVSLNNADIYSGHFPYRIRQRPGAGNALGRIKFNMKNRFVVYLHDTPKKYLFDRDVRAYSSGCVRLQDPNALAEYIMNHESGWTNAEIEERIDRRKTNSVNMADPIPVYIMYTTVRIDASGSANFHQDIYGHDKKVKRALGL